MLFSGQGKIYIGTRDTGGNPLGLVFVGNVPDFKFSLAADIAEHLESTSGSRLTDNRLSKAKKGTVSCTLEEFTKDNLALALYGSVDAVTGGSVTNEALPNPVTVGSLYPLAKQNVSALVITDSTGTPKTLPAGQYSANLKHGSLIVNDKTTGAPYVEPFKAAYSYGAANRIGMFTQAVPERWVRFEGVNTADGNKEVVVELYRVALDPTKDMALINNDYAKFELSGSVLVDTTKLAGDAMGQYGRFIQL